MPEELIGNIWAKNVFPSITSAKQTLTSSYALAARPAPLLWALLIANDQMILNAGGKTHVRLPENAGWSESSLGMS